MTLLHLDGVSKHFGAVEVLRAAELRLDPGEKVGLVGRNGAGKTTILRLIEGLETPDWGRVVLRKGASLGHVPQRPEFAEGETVRRHVEAGLAATHALVRELEDVHARVGVAQGADLERLLAEQERLTHEVELQGGWETERRVETVLSGIGLAPALWDRAATKLSGGEKSRVALARELVAGGDLLLLDEPTNHLDLEGIEWLEAWLAGIGSAVLVVSHDRRLLDRCVTAIWELERGQLARYTGNYAAYLQQKEERYASALRAWEEQQDLVRKEEAFIRRHMGTQRTAEARGRQKRLDGLARLPRPYHDVRRPVIRPPRAERGGETVLETRDLAFAHPGHPPLFAGVSLRVGRGERVGIVGRNGAGKSTLLAILAGRRAPSGGTVEYGHRAVCGFHDQETSDLREDGTPFLEIRRVLPQSTDQEVRDHLARFLFRGADVDASVSTLSGGERARLQLAKLVLTQPSWLALDEPTNHLDLAARTALEEMLSQFDGGLVCVSHDRAFLDGLCTAILEVDGGRVRRYEGNYSDWRRQKLAQAERPAPAPAPRVEVKPRPAAAAPAPSRGRAKNPYLFEKLERQIMELEAEKEALGAAVVTEEVYRDAARLRETETRIAEIESELADAYERWENWETV